MEMDAVLCEIVDSNSRFQGNFDTGIDPVEGKSPEVILWSSADRLYLVLRPSKYPLQVKYCDNNWMEVSRKAVSE